MKHAIRDSVAQIGNHTSQDGKVNAKICETFWIQEQVRDEDVSIKKEKNCANVATKPIVASVLQCCSIRKIGVLQAMDPTLHYTMMVTSR